MTALANQELALISFSGFSFPSHLRDGTGTFSCVFSRNLLGTIPGIGAAKKTSLPLSPTILDCLQDGGPRGSSSPLLNQVRISPEPRLPTSLVPCRISRVLLADAAGGNLGELGYEAPETTIPSRGQRPRGGSNETKIIAKGPCPPMSRMCTDSKALLHVGSRLSLQSCNGWRAGTYAERVGTLETSPPNVPPAGYFFFRLRARDAIPYSSPRHTRQGHGRGQTGHVAPITRGWDADSAARGICSRVGCLWFAKWVEQVVSAEARHLQFLAVQKLETS